VYRDTIQMKWETFNYFVVNLFRILQTTFYQNRPSLIEFVTKTFWLTFFLDTVYKDRVHYSTEVIRLIFIDDEPS